MEQAMKDDIDFSGYTFAKRPAWPINAHVFIYSIILIFIVALVTSVFKFAKLEKDGGAIIVVLIAALTIFSIIVIRSQTARCRRCRRTIPWFGFELDHKEALAIKSQARRDGVDILLPYATNGESCTTVSFDGFRCQQCRIIYITGVSDPSAVTS
jgi:hypothetical protein